VIYEFMRIVNTERFGGRFEELPRIFPGITDKNHDKIQGGTAGNGKKNLVMCVSVSPRERERRWWSQQELFSLSQQDLLTNSTPNIKGQDVEITGFLNVTPINHTS
jgi:hypothetical protein